MTLANGIGAGLFVLALGTPGFILAQGTGSAPAPAASQATMQDRVARCAAEGTARQLTGDARRDFVSECLAGRTTTGAEAPAPATTSGGAPAPAAGPTR
jgi:hypothetical protein